MGASFRVGRIFGIPLGISYSWFAVFALVTIFLAVIYFPSRFPQWPLETYWVIGLATSILLFCSIVAHELAHSAVSIATGVPVKEITLFIFGGVSQLERDASRPRNEFLVALAGPAASIALGLFCIGLERALDGVNEPLAALSWWLALINLSLGAFNLLPCFPLDGGRVLRSILWRVSGNFLRATRVAALCGRVGGYLFIFVGLVIIFRGSVFDGIWIAFVGWFLDGTARSSFEQVAAHHSLQGLTARDLMSGDFPKVSSAVSVSELVREHFLKSAYRTYLVAEDEMLLGLISPQSIKDLPRDRWETTSVREIMAPVSGLRKAAASEDAASLLDRMDELNLSQLPVEDEGRIVGLVRRDSLLQLVRTRSELGV